MKSLLFKCSLLLLLCYCSCVDPYDIVDLPGNGQGIVHGNCPVLEEAENDELPDAVFDYLELNHPGLAIERLEKYDKFGILAYLIELGGGFLIAFDEDGLPLGTGEREVILPEDLSPTILDYIEEHFPNRTVIDAEKVIGWTGDFLITVYLDNDKVAYFDQEENYLCKGKKNDSDDDENDDDDEDNEDDDNDDDENGDDDDIDDQLIQAIQEYINVNYLDFEIDEMEKKELCGGTAVIEVEIENDDDDIDLKLVFDLTGELLFEKRKIKPQDVPSLVLEGVAIVYPGYEIKGKPSEISLPDGTKQYDFKLKENNSSHKIIASFNDQGQLICEKDY